MAFVPMTAGGGEVGLDLINPDVIQQTNIASAATVSIPVTQLPRYVILTYSSASSATDRSGLEIYDVDGGHYRMWQYTSNGYTDSSDVPGENDVASITSSSVTVQNVHSWTARFEILIYY